LKELNKKLPIPKHVSSLVAKIEARGYMAFIVGGAVRDLLLGRRPEDWDIATDASPSELTKIFPRVIPTGIKHGTVSVLLNNKTIEVTQFRAGGHLSGKLKEDLRHRDFTINAMAYNPSTHKIIDPWGGMADLEKGIIRGVENPAKRFEEDPLRVLRAIRLAASFNFKIDNETFKTIPRYARRLKNVSVERIREEFLKMLETERPSEAVETCHKLEILEVILPELLEGHGMRQNRYHVYDVYWHSLVTINYLPKNAFKRWVGLLHDIGKPRCRTIKNGVCHFYGHAKVSAKMAREIMSRWRFSNAEIEKAEKLIANHMLHNFKLWKASAFRRLVIRVGKENIEDLLELWKADRLAHGTEPPEKVEDDFRLLNQQIKRTLETFDVFSVKDLAIGGKEIMEITGLSPGPAVGQVLRRLMDEVIKDPQKNTPDTLKDIVRKIGKDYEGRHTKQHRLGS